MKVDDLLKTQAIQPSSETDKRKAVQSESDFASMLQDELTGTDQTSQSSAVSGTSAAGGVDATNAISSTSTDSTIKTRVSLIDDVLTHIQSLGDGLQDNLSPKQLDEIMQKIGGSAEGLKEKVEGLPANHWANGMSEEVSVAAYMESVKWKRGDYL